MSKRLVTVAFVAAAAAAAAAAGLTACQPKKAATTAGAVKFNTDLPITEVMGHMVDPAAFMYWKRSGTMVDEQGEHDLSPTDEEGWETMTSGMTILMQAGNILQLEGYARAPQADWNKYAQQLTERAKVAREMSEKHDKNGTYVEGAKVYEVCVACHEQFVIQPDIKANGPAKGNPLPALPEGALKK